MPYLDANRPYNDPLQKQPETQPLTAPGETQLTLKGFVIGSRPVGSGSSARAGRASRYPINELEVTQFFEVETKKEATAVRAAIFHLRKKNPEKHFSVLREVYKEVTAPLGAGPAVTLYKWVCQRIA